MTVKGTIIGGELGNIQIRQKSGEPLAIGELLIAQGPQGAQLMQVVDLAYGSQISDANREMIAGMSLEEGAPVQFYEEHLRHYTLAKLKSLISINQSKAKPSKTLPQFFGEVRKITKDDFSFLANANGLFLGHLRSASEVLTDVPICLHLKDVLSHHILIPATTGKGKSNLMSHILWHTLSSDECGMLVLDPHDEYYGKNAYGLKDHPAKDRLLYYSPSNPPAGHATLRLHIELLRPEQFQGVLELSSAQQQCLIVYYQKYGDQWIESILLNRPVPVHIHEDTLAVVQRKLASTLLLTSDGNTLQSRGVFDVTAGRSTVDDVVDAISSAKTVIVDTSQLSSAQEILVGSVFASELLHKYRYYHTQGVHKPVASIVIEEAPRVLGKEVLERGSNIFSTIAREGRKFGVGLCAITQLPSLIPKDILANMNTKIILGIEMAPERQAIIESAAQDLSSDARNIASLDKGEAIITSNFARFATPVYVPLFKHTVEKAINEDNARKHGVLLAIPGLKR